MSCCFALFDLFAHSVRRWLLVIWPWINTYRNYIGIILKLYWQLKAYMAYLFLSGSDEYRMNIGWISVNPSDFDARSRWRLRPWAPRMARSNALPPSRASRSQRQRCERATGAAWKPWICQAWYWDVGVCWGLLGYSAPHSSCTIINYGL